MISLAMPLLLESLIRDSHRLFHYLFGEVVLDQLFKMKTLGASKTFAVHAADPGRT